jgi:glycosyltransferase involved in cell wall biosynthesis
MRVIGHRPTLSRSSRPCPIAGAPPGLDGPVRLRIPTAAILSFRLGGSDGVAVEAAKWAWALGELGFTTVTVAGGGPVDHMVPGLAIDAPAPPTMAEVTAVLVEADLVVVENLCSLPLNPPAAAVVASVLAGRPAVLHHHDLPWQRRHLAHHPPPPTDPRWRQVTINELSREQLADRGIAATTVYNSFDLPDPPDERTAADRALRRRRVRAALGIHGGRRLVVQPTRAIARKNVAGGMRAAAELGAAYWLLGPAEDGYGPELEAAAAAAACPVLLGPPPGIGEFEVDDAYRSADVVALPSTWEGFGNPTIESVAHRRPLVVGPYPVATELAGFGFRWFGLDQTDRLGAWLEAPDPGLLDHNLAVARAHFALTDLPDRVAAVLPDL